jgi:putative methionine-R-sulfoxide reductase with GAF domain
MTGGSAGARVLVVISADQAAEGDAADVDAERTDGNGEITDPDGNTEFLRGGAASDASGKNARPGSNGGTETGNNPVESGSPVDPDGPVDPSSIASELASRLSAEVVVRCGETATEYVEELGPTIDCVVVLDEEIDPLCDLLRTEPVPLVVYNPPILAVVEGNVPEGDVLDALTARVEAEIRTDRTRSKLRESNARLTALSHYAEDITACETVDAVMERTIEATTDALAFEFCVVLLIEGDRLVSRASTLPDPELSPIHVEEGIAGRTLRRGESEIVDDMQRDDDAIVEHDDLHAVLSVPIDDCGVMQVVSDRRGAFDERDREFVEILAGYTREALERIEREVTLREERDRLHAFFDVLPAPSICVEQPDGVPRVADVNAAYSEQFGDVDGGSLLSDVIPTEAELDRYETAFGTGETSTGTVQRPAAGEFSDEFTLTLVPASPPGSPECVYGIYHEWST